MQDSAASSGVHRRDWLVIFGKCARHLAYVLVAPALLKAVSYNDIHVAARAEYWECEAFLPHETATAVPEGFKCFCHSDESTGWCSAYCLPDRPCSVGPANFLPNLNRI